MAMGGSNYPLSYTLMRVWLNEATAEGVGTESLALVDFLHAGVFLGFESGGCSVVYWWMRSMTSPTHHVCWTSAICCYLISGCYCLAVQGTL